MSVAAPIELRIEAPVCTGCGTCVESCPTDVIRLDAGSRKAVAAYLDDCQACFLCVFDCPVDAISIRQHKVPRSEIGSAWFQERR